MHPHNHSEAANCLAVIRDILNDSKQAQSLARISIDSIVTTLIKGAYLGLDFYNGECYAIPYGTQMTFQTDYKGEIKLCKRYSKNEIRDIFAKVVHKGDEFYEEVDSGDQKIVFRPQPFSNSEIIGVFAIVKYKDGSMMYETMSKEEVDKVRNNYSKAKNSQAWLNSYGEMAKKTCLRRLLKYIDLNFDNIEAMQAFQESGVADFGGTDQPAAETEVVDVANQIQSTTKALPNKPQQSPQQVIRQQPARQPISQPAQQPHQMEFKEFNMVTG